MQYCFPDYIQWVAPMLMDIADAAAEESSLDLHISIFVTCLCDTPALPAIPNSTVTTTRPDVYQLLAHILSPALVEDDVEDESERKAGDKRMVCQGGVGVCASGPESLTREATNAVARLGPVHGRRVGGIALHTEEFSL
jgi:ferric-chelate reductase